MTWFGTGFVWFFFVSTVVMMLIAGFAGIKVLLAKDEAGKRRPFTMAVGIILLGVASYFASVVVDFLR